MKLTSLVYELFSRVDIDGYRIQWCSASSMMLTSSERAVDRLGLYDVR